MRVLLVTWNYPPKLGGMEMLLRKLVQFLSPHLEVDVIGPCDEDGDAADDGCMRPKRPGLLRFALYAACAGIRAMRQSKYDAILSGSTLVSPIAWLLGRLYRVPTVAIVYGLDIVYPHPMYQWLVRTFLGRCTRVVAISHMAAAEASKRRVRPDRLQVIYPGVDLSEFSNASGARSVREQYGLGDRPIILSVGRLARRKGVLDFVRHSLPVIVSQHPTALLLVVGGNPVESLGHREDLRASIEAEAQGKGLVGNVRLLGWVDRATLIRLYCACDLFVLPEICVDGDVEGFGIVLIEAGAAGRPVVSTRLGGIVDAVEDGESGFLVQAGNWDAISEVISGLLSDKPLRQRIGAHGRKRVARCFDWPVIAQRYVELLGELRRH